jgi:hypothetical protein
MTCGLSAHGCGTVCRAPQESALALACSHHDTNEKVFMYQCYHAHPYAHKSVRECTLEHEQVKRGADNKCTNQCMCSAEKALPLGCTFASRLPCASDRRCWRPRRSPVALPINLPSISSSISHRSPVALPSLSPRRTVAFYRSSILFL